MKPQESTIGFVRRARPTCLASSAPRSFARPSQPRRSSRLHVLATPPPAAVASRGPPLAAARRQWLLPPASNNGGEMGKTSRQLGETGSTAGAAHDENHHGRDPDSVPDSAGAWPALLVWLLPEPHPDPHAGRAYTGRSRLWVLALIAAACPRGRGLVAAWRSGGS